MLSILSGSFTAADGPGDPTSMQTVIATSGLNLRSAPNQSGRILAAVPFGDQVKVIGEPSQPITIGGIEGHWQKVGFRGNIGYIFDPYLSREYRPLDRNQAVHF